MITLKRLHTFIFRLSDIYGENRTYLTELDSAIGDADHGININRGFQAVKKQLLENTITSISELLKTVSIQLIKNAGGASGPLYGIFFLKASISTQEKEQLNAADLLLLFQEGVKGVRSLGKAELGEKTMIDTWIPALRSMEQSQTSIKDMLEKGLESAKRGMESTIDLLAKKGRASYLGERSIGHQDPGATSSYLLLKGAWETLV